MISDYTELVYDQAAPCFIMTFGLIFIITLGYLLSSLANMCCKGLFSTELNVDENLENYFVSLEEDDKMWMIMEEENLRSNYVNILL